MYYKKFEDIPIWQVSRKFVADIYKLIDEAHKIASHLANFRGYLVDNLQRKR